MVLGVAGGGWALLIGRNSTGDLILAEGSRLHSLNVLVAEAAALVGAVKAAIRMGWKRVWFESDSLSLIQSIHSINDEEAQSNWLLHPLPYTRPQQSS